MKLALPGQPPPTSARSGLIESPALTQPAFVAAAEQFRLRWEAHPAFGLLRLYTGCAPEELAQLVRKMHASSIPEETYRLPEGALKTAWGLLLFPLHALASKSWLWARREVVDWQVEVTDPEHLAQNWERVFDALPDSKRLAPRDSGPIAGRPCAASPYDSVRLSDLLRLAVLAPFMTLALEDLRRAAGLDVRQAYRHAVTTYAVFSGFFARFPCRRFVTYDDESNPPARVIAFRRRGGEEFFVVQNGERNAHPHIAFGLMDRYLVFGPAYERILRDIGVSARFDAVGSVVLDGRYQTLQAAIAAGGPPRDVVFVDQGVYPHNGLCERSGRSLETIVERLGELKARHPELTVAYQLRHYPERLRWLETMVREMVTKRGEGRVELLPNEDGGASYRSLAGSRLLMTFESTMGFEALRAGRKALFVNFSGDPAETLCPDPRFQLEDETADYGRFEAAVLRLLAEPLDGPPPVALERHPFIDGRTQERIAALLTGRQMA